MSTPNPKKNNPDGKSKKNRRNQPSMKEMIDPLDRPEERDVKKREAYFAFLHWTICTVAERKKEDLPEHQGAFSKKWNVSEGTLSEWKKRADFEKLRGEMFRKKLASEVPEIMADMRKRIKKMGKADEVELWLAYSEGWDKKNVVEIKPPLEFGEGDVRALIANLPKEKQTEYYVTIAKLIADARDARDLAEKL